MNVPIRMLGIATTIIWIILAAFIASAAYSMKDLSFSVGEPQFTPTSNSNLMLTLPLSIDNRGYYSLKDSNLTTTFSDVQGNEISRASTFTAVIPQNQNTTILHNVTINLNSLAENASQYLFEDTNLTCAVTAGLNFAEILPTQLATNLTFPWGAPFYNFKLGQPHVDTTDASHVAVNVPFSFDNHATFDLTGNLRVKLYDNNVDLLGETQTALNAAKYSSSGGNLSFSIPTTSPMLNATVSGFFEVYFSTPMFEYGPLVIPID